MIRLQQVSKEYQPQTPVLSRVDLSLQPGEYVYLTGPSGAGKSTLLRLIFASERPTTGQLYVAGYDLQHLRPRELPFLRRKIGFVYQDFKLLQRRTVFENIAFALEVVGRPPKEIRRRVQLMLRQVGLSHCPHAHPGQLSGGEQQRVAIARALINDPLILLADEPTGNLDPAITLEILELFHSAHLRGTTVLVATHDQALLHHEKNRNRRFLTLEQGRLFEEPPPHEPSWPLMARSG